MVKAKRKSLEEIYASVQPYRKILMVGCGNCVLAYTGGICPVTRCAKSIFNGPCGGASEGKCEVNPDIPCAWHEIYDRLKQQNRIENITDIWPVTDWHNQVQGVLVQPGFEAVCLKKT